MTISIDKIDILIDRAKVGYEEARDVLEKFDGNVVEALIYLETEDKTTRFHSKGQGDSRYGTHHNYNAQYKPSFFEKVKSFLAKAHKTKFVLLKQEKTIIDLPMTLTVLLAIVSMPFSLVLLVLALFTGHRFSIVKPNGQNIKTSEAINFVEKQQEKFNKENITQ